MKIALECVNIHGWVTDQDIARLLDLPISAVRAWCEDHTHLAQCYGEECYRMVGSDFLRRHEQIASEIAATYRPAHLVARAEKLAREAEARREQVNAERKVCKKEQAVRKSRALIAEARKVIHRMCMEVDRGLYDGIDDVEYQVYVEPDDDFLGRIQAHPVEMAGDVEALCEPELRVLEGKQPMRKGRLVSSKRWRKPRKAAA